MKPPPAPAVIPPAPTAIPPGAAGAAHEARLDSLRELARMIGRDLAREKAKELRR